jgi:hypothetical protein
MPSSPQLPLAVKRPLCLRQGRALVLPSLRARVIAIEARERLGPLFERPALGPRLEPGQECDRCGRRAIGLIGTPPRAHCNLHAYERLPSSVRRGLSLSRIRDPRVA